MVEWEKIRAEFQAELNEKVQQFVTEQADAQMKEAIERQVRMRTGAQENDRNPPLSQNRDSRLWSRVRRDDGAVSVTAKLAESELD